MAILPWPAPVRESRTMGTSRMILGVAVLIFTNGIFLHLRSEPTRRLSAVSDRGHGGSESRVRGFGNTDGYGDRVQDMAERHVLLRGGGRYIAEHSGFLLPGSGDTAGLAGIEQSAAQFG